jgi:hypothetical protein
METLTVIEQTPQALLSQAIEKGLDVESLGKLMDLQERWEANQARKKFFEAFAIFQSKSPELRTIKDGHNYKYTPLSEITRQIANPLKEAGLSYRWEIQDTDKELKVTFLVSHVDGHTERTTMSAAPDTSGSKNTIQARGSAISYLQRYTIIGGLGLSTADIDTDGRQPDDMDKLHKDYMDIYNQVIQIDSTLSKYHPDNWKMQATAKGYVKATGELRKVLFELQKQK